jgi:sensor histidine kinase YesM
MRRGNTRDRQYHDKFRRIFGPAFTNSALMGFEPTIQGYLDKMMKSVQSEAKNGSIDITSYSKYFALDVYSQLSFIQVSAKLAFGDTFNTLESDNHRPLLEIMDSMISMSKYVFILVTITVVGRNRLDCATRQTRSADTRDSCNPAIPGRSTLHGLT